MKNIFILSSFILSACVSPNQKYEAAPVEIVRSIITIPDSTEDFQLSMEELGAKFPEFIRFVNLRPNEGRPSKFHGKLCIPENVFTHAWGMPDEVKTISGTNTPMAIIEVMSEDYFFKTIGAISLLFAYRIKYTYNLWYKGNYAITSSYGPDPECGPNPVYRDIQLTDMTQY